MTETFVRTASSWQDTAGEPNTTALDQNITTQACIVGAGIAGLTTAYLLAKAGKQVVVLDAARVGSGMTSRTTAHLSTAADDRYTELEKLHGREGTILIAQSYAAAIDQVEQISIEANIDCDFERLDGYLFTPPFERTNLLDEELQAAHRAGLSEVTMVANAPIEYATGSALLFPRQAQFHPMKYLHGLAKAIQGMGGKIYSETRVIRLKGGDKPRVYTNRGWRVNAESIIVASNNPINDKLALNLRMGVYTSYVIGLKVPQGSVTKALYWDTLDPYHYIRLQPMDNAEGAPAYDLLLVGGEDHRTGQEDDADIRYNDLEEWARERFPSAETREYWWSGQVVEPVDGIAYIGHDVNEGGNVYVITGDSGMGTTHGTIGGMIVTDLIFKKRNPWAKLYDPGRVSVRSAVEFAKEGFDTVTQYTDWLTSGDEPSATQIEAGSGAIIRRGLKKLAVYRDDEGQLHSCSAVCPHLGCIVAWNSGEGTWDCPCHGSQFDPYGKVITGPSSSNLAKPN